MEKSWQTEQGSGTFKVYHLVTSGGWHWTVFSRDGVTTGRGKYKTQLGAERAAWNFIRRWSNSARLAAEAAHGR